MASTTRTRSTASKAKATDETSPEPAPETSPETSPEPTPETSPEPAAETPEAPATDSAALDFEALFQQATVEDKSPKKAVADVEVPPVWIDRVNQFYKERRRVTFPVTDKVAYNTLADLLRAAAHKSELRISATCKASYTGEGDDATLTGLILTVGDRRGASSTKAKNNQAEKVSDGNQAEKATGDGNPATE